MLKWDWLRFFICILFCALMVGCGHHPQPGTVADLSEIPQVPGVYVPPQGERGPGGDRARLEAMSQEYTQRYYRPWHNERAIYSRDELYWGVDEFRDRVLYAAQGLPYPQEWFASVRANADREGFPSMTPRTGITVRTTHVRVFPTQEPVFFDPDQAGQGYPFDMMQNSVLWTNTPVRVVHRSRDKAWLLVQTDWVSGWVRAQDVAWVSSEQQELIQQSPLLAVGKDTLSLVDLRGTFHSMAHIGTLLAIQNETRHGFQVMLPTRGANGGLQIRSGLVSRRDARPFPLRLCPQEVASLAGEMMGQIYGWGGLHRRRDCSASIRDLFTSFGLWLPRNSSQQAKAGRVIDLSGLSPADKEERIAHIGVPFVTLLWKPGHIMLYIGQYQDRPVMWHTMWGVKTKNLWAGEGRHVVGRTVITSLRPGDELSNLARPEGLLINGIERMVILGPLQNQFLNPDQD
ncbi:MAG: SH3 domain-containing protein [Desulfovermiculus sp.]